MKLLIAILLSAFILRGPFAGAAISARDGIAVTTSSTIDGVTPNSAINGLTLASSSAFSDNFNRADGSLGSNWNVFKGACDLNSNLFRCTTGTTYDYANWVTVPTGTTMYNKTKIVLGTSGNYPVWIFRFTNTSSPFYIVYYWGTGASAGKWEWQSWATATSSGNGMCALSATATITDGDVIAMTMTGSDTSTVVNIFKNPTANTPLSSSHWDSGDTAFVSFTANSGFPGYASRVNSGGTVGIGGFTQGGANQIKHDDFFGGAF